MTDVDVSATEIASDRLRPRHTVYCIPCVSRMVAVVGENGRLEADVIF